MRRLTSRTSRKTDKHNRRSMLRTSLRAERLEDRRLLAVGDLIHTLQSPDLPQTGADFGYRIATSDNFAAVSMPFANVGGVSFTGAVNIFDPLGGYVATLTHPAHVGGEAFGVSIALSDNTLVVGATGDDTGATNAGAAFVYDLTGGNPQLVAVITNPSPDSGDAFGRAVAISGNSVVVGAYFDDSGATNAGVAYFYDIGSVVPGTSISNATFTLANPDPTISDQYGFSVAVSGSKVVVGAIEDDAGASDAGIAYFYDLTDTVSGSVVSAPTATLTNPTPYNSDLFGFTVAIGDNVVAVSAPSR